MASVNLSEIISVLNTELQKHLQECSRDIIKEAKERLDKELQAYVAKFTISAGFALNEDVNRIQINFPDETKGRA